MKHRSKNMVSLLLAVLMLVPIICMANLTVQAEIVKSGKCGDNATYELDSDGVLTIKGTGSVTSKPWGWRTSTQLNVEEGITDFCDEAFFRENYETVSFPETVTSFSYQMLKGSAIKSIHIPSSVTQLGNYSLNQCLSLNKVYFSKYSSLTSIGNDCFSYCSALEHLALPLNVRTIGGFAFVHSGLKTIFLPRSLKNIGWYAFNLMNSEELVVYYEGTEEEWNNISVDYGYNPWLASAKKKYEQKFEDYMREYYHMIIMDSGIQYGIRMIASVDCDTYSFKNHILYEAPNDELGEQVDGVNIDVTVMNINNDQLDSGGMLLDINMVQPVNLTGAYHKITPIIITKGDSLRSNVTWSSEELLHLTKGANTDFSEYLGVYPDPNNNNNQEDFDESYYEVYLDLTFPIKFNTSAAKYSGGFTMEKDSYSFGNYEDYVDGRYYWALYGKNRGNELLKIIESDKKKIGLCFGMITTTSSFFLDQTKLWAFSADTTSKLSTKSVYNNTAFKIDDYIKLMDIYQLSLANKAENIINQGYSAAYAFVILHLMTEPIPISFRTNNEDMENHAVLAIGIDGSDILIYDSNTPGVQQRIINYGSSWDYSGGSYDSSNTTIVFRNNKYDGSLHLLSANILNVAEPLIDDILIKTKQPDSINDFEDKLVSIDSELENGDNSSTALQSELYWLYGDSIEAVNPNLSTN